MTATKTLLKVIDEIKSWVKETHSANEATFFFTGLHRKYDFSFDFDPFKDPRIENDYRVWDNIKVRIKRKVVPGVVMTYGFLRNGALNTYKISFKGL